MASLRTGHVEPNPPNWKHLLCKLHSYQGEALRKLLSASKTNKQHLQRRKASLVAQMIKNLPAMQETQVQSLGEEGPLEKGMVTHSSILA